MYRTLLYLQSPKGLYRLAGFSLLTHHFHIQSAELHFGCLELALGSTDPNPEIQNQDSSFFPN